MKRIMYVSFLLFVLASIVSCIKNGTDQSNQQFHEAYIQTTFSVSKWFDNLDKDGYNVIKTLELAKSVDNKDIDEFINEKEKFGKIGKRNLAFIGFWTGDKLFVNKGSKKTNLDKPIFNTKEIIKADSSMFSLLRSNDYFKNNSNKQYIFYIFNSITEHNDELNEIVVFWKKNSKWEIILYNIGKDI